MKLFDPDSPLMRFLADLFDFAVVGLLSLALCLPVVTAGASLSALYGRMLAFVREEESLTARAFFRDFRALLRPLLLPWLAFLAALAVLIADARIAGEMPAPMGTLFLAGAILLGLCLLLCVQYYLPLAAQAPRAGFRVLLRQSFLRAVAYLPRSAAMLCVWSLPLVLALAAPRVFWSIGALLILLWLSVAAYLCVRLSGAGFEL